MREERVAVDGNVALAVRRWAGDGMPVLLVHGLSSNARTWDLVARRLHERGHDVAAVDLRGHGTSDRPPHGYDFGTLVADLLVVLDTLGWERAGVAGQSLGGNLVLELAIRAPERVASGAAVDGGVYELVRQYAAWDDCAAALAPPDLAGTPFDRIAAALRLEHPDWSDEALDAFMASFDVDGARTVRARLTRERHLLLLRALWEQRPSRLFPVVQVPFLLLPSTVDPVDVERATSASPLVRVEWLAGADHDAHLQHPERVASALHDHVAHGG